MMVSGPCWSKHPPSSRRHMSPVGLSSKSSVQKQQVGSHSPEESTTVRERRLVFGRAHGPGTSSGGGVGGGGG